MSDRPTVRFAALLREVFLENLVLKFLSLVISISLFCTLQGSGAVQRSLDVPVTYVLPTSEPGNSVLLSALPEKVRVTLRGPSSVLSTIRPEELGAIQLDLRSGNPRQVRLRPDALSMPPGTTLVSFTPDVIPLQWDQIIERSLPVRATVVGALPPRARVEHVEAEPAHVNVRGPSLYVEPMVAVHTEPLDATGLPPGRYERRVPLETLRAAVQYETAQGVRVHFQIVQPVYQRRFEHLPVIPVGARAQTRPSTVTVVVQGDPAVVDHLRPDDVVPVVDCSALAPLRVATSARVTVRPLPDGASAWSTEPEEVLVVPLR
jgi:YbbR domain-containing protein